MTSVVPSKRPAEEETHSPPLKRKAPEVSDAIITSVLWTNPKDTVPGGHEVFGSLEASTTFETLREYLVAHNRVLEIFHTRLLQNNMRRLFMDQIVVMAMNDFTCRAGKPGRMVHCHGHHSWNTAQHGMLVYFAGCGWVKGQQEYYTGRAPLARLQLSGMHAGYHWQSLATSVLKIRLLSFKVVGKLRCLKTVLYLRARNVEDAIKSCGNEPVLFWIDDKLICTQIRDLLECSRLPEPHSQPDEQDPPRLRIHAENFARSYAGYLNCHWWFDPKSKECQDWADKRRITNEHLGEGLYEKLLHEFLEEGDQSTTQSWKAAYQALR